MNKKRAIATITACGLVAAMALGGSLAYLTDNESHTNTVQVSGNVRVDLVEPNWDETDNDHNGIPDESQETVPNQEIPKNPKVVNTGDNPAFVFLRLTVPVKDVTRVLDNGTLAQKNKNTQPKKVVDGNSIFHEPQDIFFFKQSNDAEGVHKNNWNPAWKRLPSLEFNTELETNETSYKDQTVGQAVYVFGYVNALSPYDPANPATTGYTPTLFDKIQVKNIIENEIAAEQIQNIKLETFAIQADNLILNSNGADGAGTRFTKTAGLSVDELTEIYNIFVQQNGKIDKTSQEGKKGNMEWNKWQDLEHGQTQKEAEISNERNLNDTLKNATTFRDGSPYVDKPELKVGETGQVTAELQSLRIDENGHEISGDQKTYTSSNPEVVSINAANGQYTAHKMGDATLTVTVDGVSRSVHVSVINDSRDPIPDTTVDANDNSNIPNGSTEPATQQQQQP